MLDFSIPAIGTIAREVERQQVDATGVARVCEAIDYAVNIVQYRGELNIRHIKTIGELIEPTNKDYRITPVTFQNGGTSAPHADIPRLMRKVMEALSENRYQNSIVLECIKEFLWIHPFKDGNGRAAFVLLNVLSYSDGIHFDGNAVKALIPLPDFDW